MTRFAFFKFCLGLLTISHIKNHFIYPDMDVISC